MQEIYDLLKEDGLIEARFEPMATQVGRDPAPYLSGRKRLQLRPRTTNTDLQGFGVALLLERHTERSTALVGEGWKGMPVVARVKQ